MNYISKALSFAERGRDNFDKTKVNVPSVTIAAASLATIAVYGAYEIYSNTKKINYEGKVVVITGASSGIGEYLAYQYAKMGAKLVLAARRAEKLDAVAEQCRAIGAKQVINVVADVCKKDDCKEIIRAAAEHYHTIDLLILNAGVSSVMNVNDITDFEPVENIINTNFWGCVYLAKYSLSFLRRSGGSIISISSESSKIPVKSRSIYCASKAALNQFFNVLRIEEPSITITNVLPGFVMSEIHTKTLTTSGIPPKINASKFMSTERCAQLIVDAGARRKREYIMTYSGAIGAYLYPIVPSLVEYLTKKFVESRKSF